MGGNERGYMAKTDTDHQDNGPRPVWPSFVIQLVMLLIIAGTGYMLGGHSGQEMSDDRTGDAGRTDDAAKQSTATGEGKGQAAHDDASSRGGDESYDYKAGEGDSYTSLARRAVSTVNSQLSPVERVAAETRLAQAAGAEMLAVGQKVAFDKATVEAAVKWAQSLSAEEKATWQPYADMVAW